MSMTAIQLVNAACYEIGETPPAALFGATDTRGLQFLNVFYAIGRDLRQKKPWPQLKKAYTFTSSAVAGYALPTDFFTGLFESGRNTTNRYSLIGSLSDADYNFLADGYLLNGLEASFRIFGLPGTNQFQYLPSTDTGSTILFDYISTNWIKTGASTFAEAITADSNTCVFDDDIMILGVQWKWKQMKGLENGWQALRADYDKKIAKAFTRYEGSKRVSMVTPVGYFQTFNSPEGNFRS